MKISEEPGLDIITQCNIKVVNYLDLNFDLNDGTYNPYAKPNNGIKYIHKIQTIHQVSSVKFHYP